MQNIKGTSTEALKKTKNTMVKLPNDGTGPFSYSMIHSGKIECYKPNQRQTFSYKAKKKDKNILRWCSSMAAAIRLKQLEQQNNTLD